MTAIIALRVYVDNFTIENEGVDNFTIENEGSNITNTGEYRVAFLTGCMIICTILLPIVCWISYIIINKAWFYEIYSAISILQHANDRQELQNLWDENSSDWQYKVFDFIKNPCTNNTIVLGYIAIGISVGLFILLAVGTYLVDYNSSDYEVESTVENAAHILGIFFISLFLLSNLQAAIVFTVVLQLLILIMPFGLSIMCGVFLYHSYCS